ncbi:MULTISPECIES: MerR family transcriptional regulator [Nocardiopsidaceae]|uniref:MerR family transcriptional regulator n=1 Tax=Streptomonospora nanhaiensis TaxID=1323731 RepID=A0ABY6YN37_9ACTN|nr:MerR family transcriptional regulator [Streptomonospora nanhaiensis]WAE73718.1 MerR family transcriptional regulator [Streptomonospora nanhaiensis]
MRIGELSERSGTPVPTIKYYLREGLLPRGERTGPNQASYGEGHLHRLRLVRALTDVGGLPIATTREILARVDSPDPPITHELLGHAMHVLPPATKGVATAEEEDHGRVRALFERRGWHVHPQSRAAADLAEVVATYRRAGRPLDDEALDGYAATMEQAARVDLDVIGRVTGTDEILESAVVYSVLGDTLMAVLRRLAQADESARRAGVVPGD